MRKITFYPTMFHTNPFSFNMIEVWDQERSNAKELFLKNNQAKEMGVSKIELNVVKFSALHISGKEYTQNDLPNRVELNAKGIDTEFFRNIKSTLKLEKGIYTSIRFYITHSGNLLTCNNGKKEALDHLDCLDFEITNDLTIEDSEELQVTMRFDFEPFSLKSYLGSILRVLKKKKPNKVGLISGLGTAVNTG